jgi:hypothetical protein
VCHKSYSSGINSFTSGWICFLFPVHGKRVIFGWLLRGSRSHLTWHELSVQCRPNKLYNQNAQGFLKYGTNTLFERHWTNAHSPFEPWISQRGWIKHLFIYQQLLWRLCVCVWGESTMVLWFIFFLHLLYLGHGKWSKYQIFCPWIKANLLIIYLQITHLMYVYMWPPFFNIYSASESTFLPMSVKRGW